MRYYLLFIVFSILLCFACTPEQAHHRDRQSSNAIKKNITEHPENIALFGDLHIHTSWSFDAFIYNVRTNPDDAYRFGKGEPIDHFVMDKIQLKRPLDFMAVTDHSEYMGVMKQMIDPEHEYFNLPLANQVRSEDRATSLRAFGLIGFSIARNEPIEIINNQDEIKTTWSKMVEAADRHYKPGQFTTFAAYEYTSSPGDSLGDTAFARNLHRNVIYKNTDKVSTLPFSSMNSLNPEDLWDWMDKERSKGIELLAIPHNANMSDGLMYATETFDGKPINKAYAEQRMRNEPINEVVQIKGQSMSHPRLSPNDEFSEFELFQYTFSTQIPPPSKPKNSFVREAFQNGLALQNEIGANPFKFGLIGSSDGHNSAGAFEEDNYFGKFGVLDGSPSKRIETDPNTFLRAKYMSGAGLAGVWAKSNTREAIFEALERKETFATSGPRMQLRFFASFDYEKDILNSKDWINKAYDSGTPMGGDLIGNGQSPTLIVHAIKDAEGANLDRIQIIKAWVDKNGTPHEKIHNIVWSDDRKLSADGSLPKLKSTVNIKEATYQNSIGSISLQAVWQDPDFDKDLHAMYYLRVLEIPTPRWSTYDAKSLGIDIPKDLPSEIVERAWSTPIWYTPMQ